ncbi:MAG: hypothetical protein LBG58_16805 [Planctomycetaceae bacterium]|nr:hypothetical protein [Planctomycetaceae bacterium]
MFHLKNAIPTEQNGQLFYVCTVSTLHTALLEMFRRDKTAAYKRYENLISP